MTERPKRKPNAPSTYNISLRVAHGPLPDPEWASSRTVNEATNGDLCDALAERGFDVTISLPAEGTVARRAKEMASFRKRQAKREAKEGGQ